jgi:hypothetical protein
MRHKNILFMVGVVLVLLGGAAVTAAEIHHALGAHTAKVLSDTSQITAVHDIKYDGQNGRTALDLLKTHADVAVKNSSYGPYVESINGVSGGGKYWMFYVNGKQASVGAGAYVTKNGDKIEWKFK